MPAVAPSTSFMSVSSAVVRQPAPVATATMVVKSARDAESMSRDLRGALQSVDPLQAVFNVATLDARIAAMPPARW